MAERFDPYHRWLGIPPAEQPADHYRLLGLSRFEDDPEVIRDAAERQMGHVRRYSLGRRSELSQSVLNELASAEACLLDSAKKTEYDRRLRDSLKTSQPPPASPEPPAAGRKPPPIPPAEVGGPVPSALRLHGRVTRSAGPVSAEEPPRADAVGGRWIAEKPLILGLIAAGAAILVMVGAAVVVAVLAGGEGSGRTPTAAGANGTNAHSAATTTAPASPGEPSPASQAAVTDEPSGGAAPIRLEDLSDQVVPEGTELRFRVGTSQDAAAPGAVRFRFAAPPPEGMTLDETSGEIRWTPEEHQGPDRYPIKLRAVSADSDEVLGEAAVVVQVLEMNQPPTIAPVADQVVEPDGELSLTLRASDADRPSQRLRFSLSSGPPGAVLEPAGTAARTLRWRPHEEHAGNSYATAVTVTDDGPATKPATVHFTVSVTAPATAGMDDGPTNPTISLPEDEGPPIEQILRTDRSVDCVALSRDGALVATAEDNGHVTIWDLFTARRLRSHLAPSSRHERTTLAFQAHTHLLVVGGSRDLEILDADSGRVVQKLPLPGGPYTVDCSPFSFIAAVGWRNQVVCWHTAAGAEVLRFSAHKERVLSLAFSRGGTLLASGSSDATVQCWDLTSGRPLGKARRHTKAVRSVALSPDGTMVASGSADQTLNVWSVATGELIHSLGDQSGSVHSVAFSPDGELLASGTADGVLRLWTVSTWELDSSQKAHEEGVNWVGFTADGRSVVSGGADARVVLQPVSAMR